MLLEYYTGGYPQPKSYGALASDNPVYFARGNRVFDGVGALTSNFQAVLGLVLCWLDINFFYLSAEFLVLERNI